jgi:nicotinamidase-related amidase
VPHCIKGTKGWEITEKLNTGSSIIIDKKSFGSLELAEYAAGHAPKEIEMVGLCTDICVIANAIILKTRLPECIISVDAQCCAGVTPKSHQNALDAMKMCQINVINEEALK